MSGFASSRHLVLREAVGEKAMTHDQLALLRSFAARPVRTIQPSVENLVKELNMAGYITRGEEGWIATPEGCNALEQQRHGSRNRI